MMVKKSTALAGIFDNDEPTAPEVAPPATVTPATAAPETQPREKSASRQTASSASRNHGSKKPVLIHIPEDMHRTLRQLSVEEGGEPLTAITERMLRQYLVSKGHTKFAPPKP